jgi:hypothetical protein
MVLRSHPTSERAALLGAIAWMSGGAILAPYSLSCAVGFALRNWHLQRCIRTMELPRKHHYKPVFFLSRWAGKDGQLCEMKLINGKVVPKRRHPAGTGYIKDLYRTDGVPEEISQVLETDFMSLIDNDAANALDKIASGQPLDAGDRIAWARFMLSLLYRNREGVEFIKAHMADIRRDATLALEPDWAALRGPLDELTLAEASAAREPAAAAKSAANMTADIIANSRAVPDIASMHWMRIDLSASEVPLLTSDRPLVFIALEDPKAYMALPIGPHDLFVAARDDRFLRALAAGDPTAIARQMNKDVVSLARQFVWALMMARLILYGLGSARLLTA